jgi:hypothetical protein
MGAIEAKVDHNQLRAVLSERPLELYQFEANILNLPVETLEHFEDRGKPSIFASAFPTDPGPQVKILADPAGDSNRSQLEGLDPTTGSPPALEPGGRCGRCVCVLDLDEPQRSHPASEDRKHQALEPPD